MHVITKDNQIYSFSKDNEPVLKIDLPCELIFETSDCFNGQIEDENTNPEKLDFNCINPATGPVFFNGVNPGDVLKVKIKSIEVEDRAIMVAEPGAGVLGGIIKEPSTKIIPIREGKAWFYEDLPLPLNKMVGVIGVAPEGEAVSCGTPGPHGGNMDNLLITEGAAVYFPVFVSGGLLAMGDLHAAMGDGEIVVTGMETAGKVRVEVSKVEGLKIKNPLLINGDSIVTIASALDLDEAVDRATIDMAELIVDKTGRSLNEVGMLMSAVGQARICQVVDPLKTARFEMPAEVLSTIGFEL